MKKNFKIILFFTGALIIFGASCRESTKVNINNSQDPNRNVPNRHASPANSDSMNHNSINHNSMNRNVQPMNTDQNSSGLLEMESSPNAANQPFDLQFIDTMTQHQQGAIVLAKMVLAKSQNQDLRKFSETIISDQEKEIEQLEGMREKWYPAEPEAINMEMPGMRESMKMMLGDRMDKIEIATGQDFDLQFLDMMSAHHSGAMTMSKAALEKGEHPELKTLSQGMLQKQEKEIKQMMNWKETWLKKS